MKHPVIPFALPPSLSPDLSRVLAYWESLKRGEGGMPFSDDVSPTSFPALADRMMLIDVIEKPPRFRLGLVGRELTRQHADMSVGRFVDELELRSPLEFLQSQCSATIESTRPTFYGSAQQAAAQGYRSYSRLMLPTWGGGHIAMLMVAFDWA